MRFCVALLWCGAGWLMAQQTADFRGWLNQGVQAFRNGRYDEAIQAFQKAADLEPSNVAAHLYLGTAYMQRFIPGNNSQENRDHASRAEAEFQRVLTLDATNQVALASIASLKMNQRQWADARDWYNRILGVDSKNTAAYYSLGFIAWSEWYPEYAAARSRAGLRPEDPGPLPEGPGKQELENRYVPTIEDGIANLNRALQIDPAHADAMAYLNLLIRERADLKHTRQEYLRDVAEADEWVTKALAAKKEKAEQMVNSPPPPTPPPSGSNGQAVRIKVGEGMQEQKLVNRVPPAYPPLASQARIQGTVRLSVVILKDGTVGNITVIGGHPLLMQAALDAVKQWRYRTTLLNGEPVEVQTTVSVEFALDSR